MEEVFETLEIAGVHMTTARSPKMIEPIANRNFDNAFYLHNGPNQHQYNDINTHFNSINPVPSKYQRTYRLHT